MHAHTCPCTHTHTHTHTHAHICTHTHAHTHARTHAHTPSILTACAPYCAHTHTHTHTHTHRADLKLIPNHCQRMISVGFLSLVSLSDVFFFFRPHQLFTLVTALFLSHTCKIGKQVHKLEMLNVLIKCLTVS